MNTFGGIIGSLAAGFVMIPGLGAWKTLVSAGLASTVLAFVLLALSRRLSWIPRVAWAAGLATVASLAAIAPSWNIALFNQGLYREVYTARRLDLERTNHDQLVYYSEGINSPVAVFNGEAGPGRSVSRFEDHQFLTTNPANGHLYLTETMFTAAGKPVILFSRSTDGGQTWLSPVSISDRAGNVTFQDSFAASGKDPSTVYVTFGAFANHNLSNCVSAADIPRVMVTV